MRIFVLLFCIVTLAGCASTQVDTAVETPVQKEWIVQDRLGILGDEVGRDLTQKISELEAISGFKVRIVTKEWDPEELSYVDQIKINKRHHCNTGLVVIIIRRDFNLRVVVKEYGSKFSERFSYWDSVYNYPKNNFSDLALGLTVKVVNSSTLVKLVRDSKAPKEVLVKQIKTYFLDELSSKNKECIEDEFMKTKKL